MEHLNESPARVSVNISWPPINCDSLSSNYIVSSKSFAKDEIISTKNLSITDVTKNSVNSKPFNNSKSSLKNTHREKAPSNKITALTKSRNMSICVVGTSNQFFIRGSQTETKFSKMIGLFCTYHSICFNIGF